MLFRGYRKLFYWKDGEIEVLRGVMFVQGFRLFLQDFILFDQFCGEYCSLVFWQFSMEGRGGGSQFDIWRFIGVGFFRFVDQRGARVAFTFFFVAVSVFYLFLVVVCSLGLFGVVLFFVFRLFVVFMYILLGRVFWGQVRIVRIKYRFSGLWQVQGLRWG